VHPLDKQALDSLKRIPGIRTLLRGLVKYTVELSSRLSHHATFLKVSQDQLPDLHRRFRLAGERLGMGELPDLFVYQDAQPNAYTFGVDQYFVAISTGALELMTDEEVLSILGHELGHVQADHVLFKTAAAVFEDFVVGPGSGMLDGMLKASGLVYASMRLAFGMALKTWDRASELTGDRASLLVVRKPHVVLSSLMKLAGGTPKILHQLSVDAFIKQAESFEKMRDTNALSKVFVALDTVFRTHPFPVYRAREALDFVQSGELLRILDGHYNKLSIIRTQPCPKCGKPVGEASIICPHCTADVNGDDGEAGGSVGDKLGQSWGEAKDWVKRTFSSDDEA